MFDLKGKTVVVTGAGSGIGRAVSILLAARGGTVHIVEKDLLKADSVLEEIKTAGGDTYLNPCDVTNDAEVRQVFDTIGAVDILVNSAGISHIGNIETTTEKDFEQLFEVNVKGVFHCMKAAIPAMKVQHSGVIVNLASIANHVGLERRFAYSMTKGAVFAMTLSVARDYLEHGIRCNCVSPARVHTPFVDQFLQKNYPGKEKEMFQELSLSQPIGRMAKPEEIASLILFLCSDEASFITGCDYPIDGGFIRLNN